MKILGVDPALSITGYGLIDFSRTRLAVIEAGIIKTSSRMATEKRLQRICRAIEKLIIDTRPEVVVLEKLFAHYRHPTTAYFLGQARGVICLAAANAHIMLAEYGATRIKKAIVGNGLASKQQVQRMVADLLKLDTIPAYTDVTDALALAIGHGYIINSGLRTQNLK